MSGCRLLMMACKGSYCTPRLNVIGDEAELAVIGVDTSMVVELCVESESGVTKLQLTNGHVAFPSPGSGGNYFVQKRVINEGSPDTPTTIKVHTR